MKSRQYQAILYIHAALVANAPKDTWNLALHGIKIIQDAGKFYVAVGGENAPYAEQTNEAWKVGKNPNEGWIDRTLEEVLPYVKQIMSGALTEKEVEESMQENYYKSIKQQRADFIARKEREYANI